MMRLLLSVAAAAAVTCAGAAARAQADPFLGIRTFDYQNRRAVDEIHRQIVAARQDPAKLAPIEARLIAALNDESATFAGKQEICKFLWFMGTSRSVPALAKLLAGDQKAADAARYALERIPGPEAGAALRAAMLRASGLRRIGIVNSLGARRDRRAAPALAALLKANDKPMRDAAVSALGRIGTEQALSALKPLGSRDIVVCQALLRCADGLAAAGKAGLAEQLLTGLTAQGRPTVARVSALRSLAALKRPAVLPLAMKLSSEPDAYVRRGAAAVLAGLAAPAAVKAIVAGFPKLPPEAKIVLLAAWGDRREPLAAAVSLRAASDVLPEVRAAAIRAAARTGGAGAVPAVAEIAAKGDGEAGLAREALAGLPGQASARAIERLSAEGRPEVRAAMMAVLAERPGASSMAALMAGAGAADSVVAVAALRAIGNVGGSGEVEPVVRIMAGAGDDGVREAAARAIVACAQRSGEREAAVSLAVGASGSASLPARMAALGVLAELGGTRALTELTRAASSPESDLKRAAVQGLADTWADSGAMPVLLGIAKGDQQRGVRVIALRGYLRLAAQDGRMSADDKATAIEQGLAIAERPDEKRQAFGALRDCRTEQAVSLIAAHLGESDVFAEAAEAVLDLAAPQKRYDRNLPAVKGAAMTAALDKIIELATDEGLKERARKAR